MNEESKEDPVVWKFVLGVVLLLIIGSVTRTIQKGINHELSADQLIHEIVAFIALSGYAAAIYFWKIRRGGHDPE